MPKSLLSEHSRASNQVGCGGPGYCCPLWESQQALPSAYSPVIATLCPAMSGLVGAGFNPSGDSWAWSPLTAPGLCGSLADILGPSAMSPPRGVGKMGLDGHGPLIPQWIVSALHRDEWCQRMIAELGPVYKPCTQSHKAQQTVVEFRLASARVLLPACVSVLCRCQQVTWHLCLFCYC